MHLCGQCKAFIIHHHSDLKTNCQHVSNPNQQQPSVPLNIHHHVIRENELKNAANSSSSGSDTAGYSSTTSSMHTHNFMGCLVSPCHPLMNTQGQSGFYFIFPDMSIRTSGQYRIQFHIYNVQQ